MVEGRSRRHSGRQPKSYRFDDVFKDIEDLDSDASKASKGREEDEEEDVVDEFQPGGDEEEDDGDEFDDVDDGDEEEGDEEDGAEGLSHGEPIAEVNSDMDASTPVPSKRQKGKKGNSAPLTMGRGFGPGNVQAPSRFTQGTGVKVRQRGVEDYVRGAQELRFMNLFGPTDNDMYPALMSRDTWKHQETLPSRSQGSLHRSFWISDEAAEKEIMNTRAWYANIGLEAFASGQVVTELSEEEGQAYTANDGQESMNVLLGDIKKPSIYNMRKGEYLNISSPFGSNQRRRGWNFFLGSRIQEAQWAPNEKGRTQYLAVAVEQKQTTGRQYKPLETPKAPAFTATKPFPASIQIWAFDSLDSGDLDPSKAPRLEQVICTDWGAPKSFRWWPIGPNDSAESLDGTVRFGLLAGIWSDGRLRILDISHQKPDPDLPKTQFKLYTRAAFEISFPETIPTCLHWLSGTTLAAATASGNIAIWTLTQAGMFPPLRTQGDAFIPQPWFYKQVADTYVLTLTSGYPSRPHFVSVTTADGFGRLFDLRSPTLDACSSVRGRMLILAQGWHDQTQSFVMSDEYYMLRHNPVRCYYRNVYTMRIESSVTCCATSPVQPCILLAGTDGIVIASNTTAKVLHSKTVPWQQPWFKHEWRPPVEQMPHGVRNKKGLTDGNTTTDQLPDAPISTTGRATGSSIRRDCTLPQPLPMDSISTNSKSMIRITEGYKAYQVALHYPESSQRYKEGAKYVTIYEEKSAISKLAWNPNLNFGTWAVAGMNSGMLRVEDLGV